MALAITYVDHMALAMYQTQPGVMVPLPFDDFAWAIDRDGQHARWFAHALRATQLLYYRSPELLPLPVWNS